MNNYKILLLFLGSLSLALISGCSSTHVSLHGEFPSPLVHSIPLTAQLQTSDEFLNYSYKEDAEDRSKFKIELGSTQLNLFDSVFSTLFQNYLGTDSLTDDAPDLIIQPELTELQYSTPRENNSKIFEIWLSYKIAISDKNNQLIQEWPISAYGKSTSALVGSAKEGFFDAAMMALRDLGVSLTLKLPKQPQVQQLVQTKQLAQTKQPIQGKPFQQGENTQ
ncbi:MAG: hypothetical protein K6L73_02785 [Cellvibrionaceae bacterium]